MARETVTLSSDDYEAMLAALAKADEVMRLRWEDPADWPKPEPYVPPPPVELSEEDLPQIREAFAEGERRRDFWAANYRRLAAIYPEQFIAVRDGCVVAAEPDLVPLVDRLADLSLDLRDTYIEFMALNPRPLIL